MRILRHSLLLSSLLLSSLALAACGGSGSEPTGGSGSKPGGEGADSCKESTVTGDVTAQWIPSLGGGKTLAYWLIVGVLDRPEGPSALLQRDTEDGAAELAFVGPDGKLAPLAKVPKAGQYEFIVAPVSMPNGKRCAVYAVAVDGAKLQFACEDGSTEDSGFEISLFDSGPGLLPIVTADGTLTIFTTTHASYTMLRRTAQGQWEEIEQYESSISWPEDAVLHDGAPVSCFIGVDDRAHIVTKAGELTSAVQAESCKIAVDDTAVHVLFDMATDTGYAATIPWSNFNGSGGSFEVKPTPTPGIVLTMGVSGGEAFLVTLDYTNLKLLQVGLDSGAITTLGPAEDESFSYTAIFDADEGVLTVASSPEVDTSIDGEVIPQSIHIATYCLSK
ncbi:hypothetical protein [Polyangium aurulentum]|uniref:hypothetical protein n=1 Tax=Polyangium aurulentum TaxID=2567896 RepID=UPI0010AE9682|nr:hypothetical protein [Polyangium aurulentum]UQA62801.1 hypothetical protein E8A73_021055 [Polyangium aurulentum]